MFKRLEQLRKATLKGLFEGTFYCTMFWSSHSEPQTYVTNANSIDGGSNIVHRPISPKGMPSCTVFHYTVYSHYTATIQPEEVVSEAWGLFAWEPQRSGAVRSTSGSTRNVLCTTAFRDRQVGVRRTYCTTGAGWSLGEFPGAPTVRIGQDSVPRL